MNSSTASTTSSAQTLDTKPENVVDEKDLKKFEEIVNLHQQVKVYAEDKRRRAKLPECNSETITDDLAQKAFLLKYKGFYIKPDLIVPEETKRVIDKFVQGQN